MAQGRPVDDDTRARAIELIKQGLARNAIARELRIAPSTVSGIAADAGLTFERHNTAAASAARQADLKQRRLDMIDNLYSLAQDHLSAIQQPYRVFSFGGRDNTYAERVLEEPPTPDKLNLHRAASLALRDARDLMRDDDDQGVGEAESMLMNLILELGLHEEAADD